MPTISLRPIIKSPLPFKYGQSSDDGDDDYEYARREYESTEVHQVKDEDDQDDGMPQMVEVHVNGSPKVPQ